MKRFTILTVLLALMICSVHAQNADIVTKILDSEKVTYGQVAYMCCCQNNLIKDSDTQTKALNILKDKNLAPTKAKISDAIPMDDIALIVCETYKISNSFMYRVTSNKRYAYRQLKADKIIDSKMDPSFYIDGHEFMKILTLCIEKYDIKKVK